MRGPETSFPRPQRVNEEWAGGRAGGRADGRTGGAGFDLPNYGNTLPPLPFKQKSGWIFSWGLPGISGTQIWTQRLAFFALPKFLTTLNPNPFSLHCIYPLMTPISPCKGPLLVRLVSVRGEAYCRSVRRDR